MVVQKGIGGLGTRRSRGKLWVHRWGGSHSNFVFSIALALLIPYIGWYFKLPLQITSVWWPLSRKRAVLNQKEEGRTASPRSLWHSSETPNPESSHTI